MSTEAATGAALFFKQFAALLKKNAWLALRNKKTTISFLLFPFAILLIVFAVDRASGLADRLRSPASMEVRDPKAVESSSIPACEDRFFYLEPCYDFVWSGNSSSVAQQIVGRILENNPGRHIPSSKVKSFSTEEQLDEWLFNAPLRTPAALHLRPQNATVVSYGIQINSTTAMWKNRAEDSSFKFFLPLQISAEREIARFLLADPDHEWSVGFKEYSHPDLSVSDSTMTRSDGYGFASLAPLFLIVILQFSFTFQLHSFVFERESKLRQAMNIMGLYDSVYWLTWLTWEGVMTAISSALTVASGRLLKFDLFLYNSFEILFLLFFLFQLNMISIAIFLSPFVKKASNALNMGFIVYLFTIILQIAMLLLNSKAFIHTLSKLLPQSMLTRAIMLLGESDQYGGFSWNTRTKCPPSVTDCDLTFNGVYIWLTSSFFLWLCLALYVDNMMPGPNGIRKPIFYFLSPRYWTGKNRNMATKSCSALKMKHTSVDDEDVLEEEKIVKEQMDSGVLDSQFAVQIRGLIKTYKGKRKKPFHAIGGLWMNINKDQLFCLLGPNGAGKTTTIGCLTGIISVTGGDALIYGSSIRSSVSMSNIQKIIGVCPQFDILWKQLTGEEHLELFANIKGLPSDSIRQVVRKSLAEVDLTSSSKVRAGSYSGGMRRRLSVAMALLGDPKLVILDEPTTGMDPISRRQVWDIIEKAKRGRAVILTTHSMEEADILGDRIGIMVKGRLRCIGTSIRLKSKFGTGFVANVSFSGSQNGTGTDYLEATKKFFNDHLDVKPKEEGHTFLTFVIPREKEGELKNFFAELQYRERELGISDIQLGLTTLEEVFLNIARQAELEAAAAEGRTATITLSSGTSVKVPIGARFVGIPGTEAVTNPKGMMVEVYWEQDESGALCVSGQSDEMPVPPHIPLDILGGSRPRRLGKKGEEVQGIAIYSTCVEQ